MARVYRVSLKGLSRKLRELPGYVEHKTVKALRETAHFGRTAVLQHIRSKRGMDASGTYKNSWEVKSTWRGAILGNTSLQSYFMEVGRKPNGRMPPTKPLLHWIIYKKYTRSLWKKYRQPVETILYRIRRKIAIKGLRSQRVLRKQLKPMQEFFEIEVKAQLRTL